MVDAMETRMSMHQPLQVGASLLFMVIQALGEEVVKFSPNCLGRFQHHPKMKNSLVPKLAQTILQNSQDCLQRYDGC